MKKRITDFVTFFSFSGFYLGIEFLLAINMSDYTRFYSIPIRVALCLSMILYMMFFSNRNKSKGSGNIQFKMFLYFFWFIYIMKVLYFMLDPSLNFGKEKYEFIYYTIAFCILPFSFYQAIDINKHQERIVNIIIFSGLCLGVLTTYLYFDIIISGQIGRLNQAQYMGFEIGTINPLMLAYAGASTIGMTMYRLIYNPPSSFIRNIYYYMSMFFSGIMLLLGASRGSVIALVVTFIIFYFFGNRSIRRKFLIIFTISIPLLVWGAIKVGSSIFDRTAAISVSSNGGNGDSNERLILWEDALNEFYSYPILGGKIEVSGIYPHNFLVEILMATGVIGFLCFIIPFGKSIKMGNSLVKHDRNNVWLVVLLIQGCIHYFFSEGLYYSIQLFIPMGMMYSKMRTYYQ